MKDNSLILALLKTYEDPEPRFADFAIYCTGENGEEIVWCHLLVLRLRSEYFNGLLRMEPETKSISLHDYSSEVVRAVVKSAIAVDEEELKKPINVCASMFDNNEKEFPTVEENLAHMQKEYGFFVPDMILS